MRKVSEFRDYEVGDLTQHLRQHHPEVQSVNQYPRFRVHGYRRGRKTSEGESVRARLTKIQPSFKY